MPQNCQKNFQDYRKFGQQIGHKFHGLTESRVFVIPFTRKSGLRTMQSHGGTRPRFWNFQSIPIDTRRSSQFSVDKRARYAPKKVDLFDHGLSIGRESGQFPWRPKSRPTISHGIAIAKSRGVGPNPTFRHFGARSLYICFRETPNSAPQKARRSGPWWDRMAPAGILPCFPSKPIGAPD